jgi:hypothetical protein
MKIKGEYRDVLTDNGNTFVDMGWKSNTIVADFGKFLAVLMKKDFNPNRNEKAGIDYIAFGNGSTIEELKNRVMELLNQTNPDLNAPFWDISHKYWVWLKQIDKSEIRYIEEDQTVSQAPTNRIKLDVVVEENQPPSASGETFDFKQFGLFGADRDDNGKPKPNRIFFINHVTHEEIGKTSEVKLTRTIILRFL